MNSTSQDNQSKPTLSKKLKNIFTLSLFAKSRASLTPTTALGKNHQPTYDLLNDSNVQQSTIKNTSLRELFPRFLSTGFALFVFSGNLFAGGASLAWDPSTSSNIGGYKVSYGQSSGNYASTIDVGNTTTYSVSGLQEGTKYYFAVKAYDSARTIESAYSNETNLTVPVPVTTAITTDFTASTTSGPASLAVNFTPVISGTVTSWKWDFVGAYTPSVTNSTGQVVTVTYPNPGTYSVSLTATGPSGSVTKTKANLITVTAPPPVVIPPPIVAPPPATPPPPVSETSKIGLVAAYGFEEVSGKTVADASGNGNHGTIKEAVRITTGRYGKALKFDGMNDWVTVNNSASLALSTGMTLEAWVYQQSSMSNTIILKEGTGFASYEFYSSEDKDLPISYFNDGSYQSVFGTNPVPLNQWTHLVSTFDGQYQRLYVNGVEVAKSAQNGLIQQSTGVLRIGGNSLWGEYFQGYIDEVRIYNRALTAAEVNNNLVTAVSVSNPQQFILGNTILEPWIDYRKQGIAEAFQAVPKKSSVVTFVKVYLDATSTATTVVAGIYENNNGHPGTLVAKGTLTTPKSGVWNSVQIPVAPVTAGQPYWIAILGSKGQIGFLDQVESGTGLMETSASSSLTTLPSTWTGSATKANAAMSVFGNGY